MKTVLVKWMPNKPAARTTVIAGVVMLAGLLSPALMLAQSSGEPPALPPPEPLIQPVFTSSLEGANFQEEYSRIVNGGEAVNAIDLGQFGESVDIATGKTEFTAVDVSLPGNNAIPVAVGRSRSVDNHGGAFARMLGDWDLDIPYMEGVFIKGQQSQLPDPQGWIVGTSNPALSQYRCSGPSGPSQMQPPAWGGGNFMLFPQEFWQGIHLHAPGQGRQEVLYADTVNPRPTDGPNYRYVTSGRWYLSCDGANGLPSGQGGDGYIARSPDGLIYRFNWMVAEGYAAISRPRISDGGMIAFDRQRIRLYPTSVEDRYGNSVTYTWSGSRLTQISGKDSLGINDGRVLTLTWNGFNGASCNGSPGVICSVNDGTRTWSYDYETYGGGQYSFLTSVTQPDSSQWTLGFQGINSGMIAYKDVPQGGTGPAFYDTALGHLE